MKEPGGGVLEGGFAREEEEEEEGLALLPRTSAGLPPGSVLAFLPTPSPRGGSKHRGGCPPLSRPRTTQKISEHTTPPASTCS
jgi:hypothetical protein